MSLISGDTTKNDYKIVMSGVPERHVVREGAKENRKKNVDGKAKAPLSPRDQDSGRRAGRLSPPTAMSSSSEVSRMRVRANSFGSGGPQMPRSQNPSWA